MMYRKLRKYFYSLTTLVTLIVPQESMAKISPKAFKGITKYFNDGQEYYSPVLGEAALESGLIYNLRFYGNFDPKYEKNNSRLYIADSARDALSDLVKTLFPSPAGQLSIETMGKDNFGKYVRDPATVALLLNFSKEVRTYLTFKKELSQEISRVNMQNQPLRDELSLMQEAIAKIRTTIDSNNAEKERLKKQELPKEQLKKSLADRDSVIKDLKDKLKGYTQQKNTLERQIKAEKALITEQETKTQALFEQKKNTLHQKIAESLDFPGDQRKTFQGVQNVLSYIEKSIKQEKDFLYPEHTTEQVISAFFCEKFNHQEDIWALLHHLDGEIVNKSAPLPIEEDYLTKEDLSDIASKPSYDLDDVFALVNAGVFDLVTPYKSGSVVSNGQAYPYDRTNDSILNTSPTFAECAETSARHIMNLLLFNRHEKIFDLRDIEAYVKKQGKPNPYFEKFSEFYQVQPPSSANNGDLVMRSLWNRVVGDLNAFKDSSEEIIYMKDSNEVSSSFINFINIFQKIFGLSLEDFPKGSFDDEKTWLKNSLKTLFTAVNPQRTYEMDLSELRKSGEGITGTLPVTVQEAGTDLFSFDFCIEFKRHSEIRNLTILKETEVADYTPELTSHRNTVHGSTAEEALWLLGGNEALQSKAHHPLHALFKLGLSDNNSRIDALEILHNNYENWKASGQNISLFKTMLRNILSDISWNDMHTVESISPAILNLYTHNDLKDVLHENVKGFKFSDRAKLLLYKQFTKLEALDLSKIQNLEGISLEDWPNLRTLYLRYSKIRKIDPKNLLSLETLDLFGSQNLEEVPLEDLPNLRTLNLSLSGIKKIDAKNFSALETLDLYGTQKLEEITLVDLPNFRTLKLTNSKIKKFNAKNLSGLKTLDLSSTRNLEEVSLGELPNLRTLNLSCSRIKKFDAKNFSGLETLDLSCTTNLEEVSLGEFPNLRTLTLSLSEIKKLDAKNLSGLETLDLCHTKELEEAFLGELPNLRTLNLSCSRIKKFDVKNFSSLESLDLSYTKNLEGLFLKDMPNFKSLNLKDSVIKKTLLLENLENLEELDLSTLTIGESIVFRGSFKNLKSITFNESQEPNIIMSNIDETFKEMIQRSLKTTVLKEDND